MDSPIKKRIIDLIARTDDDEFLEQVLNILDNHLNYSDDQLFEQQSEYQKKETLLSLQESSDEKNLVDHDQVMSDIRKKYGWS